MSDENVEKGRRRSARVYVRPDKLTPEELDQRLAVVARYFPSDEDEGPTPAHTEARARTRRAAKPAVGKGLPGNPVPPTAGRDLAGARVSAPLTAGRASPSQSDHGVGQGRSAELAWNHPDLRQGRTDVVPFANAASNDPSYMGNAALNASQAIGRPFRTQEPSGVQVDRLSTPMLPAVRALPSGDPTSRLPAHRARDSAVPANGSHSTAVPSRPPTQAMKAQSPLEIMKQLQRRMDGRG